jgi:predicted Zn-dependent protease
MSKARAAVIVLSLLVGTAVMVFVIVPLNVAALRSLTGRRAAARAAEVADRAANQREVARAFGDAARPGGQGGHEEFRDVLNAIGNSAKGGDAVALNDLFDGERMAEEFRRAGALKGLAPPLQWQFAAGVKRGMIQALTRPGNVLAWTQTEVRSVKLAAGGTEAVVIARHRDARFVLKIRWWLTRAPGDWRVYDFEELDSGLRMSTLMASLLPHGDRLPAVPPEWVKATPAMQEASAALKAGNLAGAAQAVKRLENLPLPPKIDAVRWLLDGSVKIGQRRFWEAEPCLDRARALNPDMPCLDLLYATVYNQTGKPREALAHVQKYRALLGDDPDTLYQLGLAQSRLGRKDEAAATLRKCLAEEPGAVDCLLELRRVLPRGRKGELAAHYARLPQGEQYFEELALAALGDRDGEAVEAYVAVLRRRNFNDPTVDACEARAKALAGQAEAAAALFKKALANMPAGQGRTNYLHEFLLDLAETRDALRAYRLAPDAREGFAVLAQELLGRRDEDGLRGLLAAHRRAQPDDPWLNFYAGELHADAREFDQADRAFAAAQAKLKDEAARERVRARRVFVRYQAGKGLSAYDDIGPRRATFQQLANQFALARDRTRLAALLAAHRRHDAEDPQLALWEAETAWLAKDHAAAVRLLQKHRDGVFADPRYRYKFVPRLLCGLVKLGRVEQARREAETLARRGAVDRHGLRSAFNELIRDRNHKGVEALAAALRAAAPDDAEGLVWQARAEILWGRLPQAGELMRSALPKQAQPFKRDQYLREFLYDTVAAGKAVEGYRLAPEPDRAFRIVADTLLNGYSVSNGPEDDFDDDFPDDGLPPNGVPTAQARELLRQLIDAHRARRPQDAAPDLYAGALYRREGKYEQAAAAFARGLARNPPADLRQRFRYDQVETLYRAGKGLTAYTQSPDRQTFVQLANLCVQDRKAKDLLALTAAHRRTDPADPALPLWEAEARFVAGDYAAALKQLKVNRDAILAQPNERWKFKDLLVRCLVRLKRFDEALKAAQAFAKERNGNLLLPAVVYAAAGDVAQTRAQLEKCARRYYNAFAFYGDPDLGPALCSEPFRELHRRYPERLPLPLSERGRRVPRF